MRKRKCHMSKDEMQLLDKVKDFTTYDKLCIFFNRSERTIRNALWRLRHKRDKYYYSYHIPQATVGRENGRIKKHLTK